MTHRLSLTPCETANGSTVQTAKNVNKVRRRNNGNTIHNFILEFWSILFLHAQSKLTRRKTVDESKKAVTVKQRFL